MTAIRARLKWHDGMRPAGRTRVVVPSRCLERTRRPPDALTGQLVASLAHHASNVADSLLFQPLLLPPRDLVVLGGAGRQSTSDRHPASGADRGWTDPRSADRCPRRPLRTALVPLRRLRLPDRLGVRLPLRAPFLGVRAGTGAWWGRCRPLVRQHRRAGLRVAGPAGSSIVDAEGDGRHRHRDPTGGRGRLPRRGAAGGGSADRPHDHGDPAHDPLSDHRIWVQFLHFGA